MAREQPIELFMPPNMLKAKAGSFGGLDMAAIRRAETAMETLKSEFNVMAADDIRKLVTTRDAYLSAPGADTRAAMARAALDLKGQAATFDFPLIARVAASLAHLMSEISAEAVLPMKLVDAHVSAIQVMHRQNLTGGEDKLSLTLIAELDAQVAAVLKA